MILTVRSINLASQFPMKNETRNLNSAVCPDRVRLLNRTAKIILRIVKYANKPVSFYDPLGKPGEKDYSMDTRRYPLG
jgi:hypothetical protein